MKFKTQLAILTFILMLHANIGGVIIVDDTPSLQWFANYLMEISSRFSNLMNNRHEIMTYSTQHVLNILEQYKLILSVIQQLHTFMMDNYMGRQDSEAEQLQNFHKIFNNATAYVVSLTFRPPQEVDNPETLRSIGTTITDVCWNFKKLSNSLPNRPIVIDKRADAIAKYFSQVYIDNETSSVISFLHDLRRRNS